MAAPFSATVCTSSLPVTGSNIFGQGACPSLVPFNISLSTRCGRLCNYKTKVRLKHAAGALMGVVANVQSAACSLLLCVTGEEEHWRLGGQHREVHHLPVWVWRRWGCAVSASRVSHCLSVCLPPQYKYCGLFLVLLQFNPLFTDILYLGGNLLASWVQDGRISSL